MVHGPPCLLGDWAANQLNVMRLPLLFYIRAHCLGSTVNCFHLRPSSSSGFSTYSSPSSYPLHDALLTHLFRGFRSLCRYCFCCTDFEPSQPSEAFRRRLLLVSSPVLRNWLKHVFNFFLQVITNSLDENFVVAAQIGEDGIAVSISMLPLVQLAKVW